MTGSRFDLTGKVVLITGANSGLGLAWADGIAAAGADVVIWGRRPDANEAARLRIAEHGRRVLAQQVDVSQEQQVTRALDEAVEALGRIDGAVINAGVNTPPPSFAELDAERWHALLATNLHGSFYSLRAVVRHMLERHAAGDPGGSLVLCGSLSVSHGVPKIAHYAAAKGAMASMTRSLAVEHGRYGIRANMVLPGRIATELGTSSAAEKRARSARAAAIPLGRIASPEECVGIVVYLLGDAASYHTGDLITVDGGLAVTLP